MIVTCFGQKKHSRVLSIPDSQPYSTWSVWVPFPFNGNELLRAPPQRRFLHHLPLSALQKTWGWHHVTMAMAEFVVIFKPESNSEQEKALEESQQPRMNTDVSQCLVVTFITSTPPYFFFYLPLCCQVSQLRTCSYQQWQPAIRYCQQQDCFF